MTRLSWLAIATAVLAACGSDPEPSQFSLVVSAAPAGTGSGTVTGTGGLDCTITAATTAGTCTADYTDGASVTLAATPAAEAVFSGWSGSCTGSGVCALTMSADRAVTATFSQDLSPVTLTVAAAAGSAGGGTVVSQPAGINCVFTNASQAGACSASFASGTNVHLLATRAAGSRFAAWSPPCSGRGECVLSLAANTTVDGAFERIAALSFDGAQQFAQAPDASSLDLSAQWTIEAWIRPSSVAAGFHELVSKWGTAPDASYTFELNGPLLRIATNNGIDATTVLESPAVIVADAWQHVAVTFSAGSATLYRNGVQVAQAAGMALPANSAKPLSFGREGPPFNGNYYGGLMDEVRIWQVARTAAELHDNMGTILGVPQAGLVGYWRFDEGEDQLILDISGFANHGKLGASVTDAVGDPVWTIETSPADP